MIVVIHLPAGAAVSAPAALEAEHSTDQGEGHEALADSFGPFEEIGMGQAVGGDGSSENVLLPVVSEDLSESHARSF
jgi:hypothetical protein